MTSKTLLLISFFSIFGLHSLLIVGCDLKRDFKKGTGQAITVSEPDLKSKGDRPQETGEGLPGYLIEPSLILLERTADSNQIIGSPTAVRTRDGSSIAGQEILVIGYKVGSNDYRREKDALILSGRSLGRTQSDTRGAFRLTVSLDAGEMIFLRLSDAYAEHELAFKPGQTSKDRVTFDPASNAFVALDSTRSQAISYNIDPEGTQQAQLATLKATRTCRGCDLSGANLRDFDLNGCHLVGSQLVGSDLTGVDMRNCQLQRTNFSGANLTRVDLSGADLTDANFSNTTLTDAILNNVKGYSPP